MKRFILLLLLTILLFSKIQAQRDANSIIAKLLSGNDMFELEEQYLKHKADLIPMMDYLSRSLLYNAFNQPQHASNTLDTLIRVYNNELGFNSVCNLTLLRAEALANNLQYPESIQLLQSFQSQHIDSISEEIKEKIKSSVEFKKALMNQPLPELIRPSADCIIDFTTEQIGRGTLMFVPCRVNGKKAKMIFDTGCSSFNFSSESFAKEHGFRMVMDSLMISGVGSGMGWLGIADSISIGEIIYKNALFIVAPESPSDTVYKVEAVLGNGFLKTIGEIQIMPEEMKIIFPVTFTKFTSNTHNMMAQNGQSYLNITYKKQRLLMHFDTGNVSSDLYKPFYNKHKKWVERKGKKDTIKVGGFGDIKMQNTYQLSKIKLSLSNIRFSLKNIHVNTGSSIDYQWIEDGSLGMSFIQQFKKVVISYHFMRVEVKK